VTSGECCLAGACNCQSCMNEKTNEDLQHSLSVESDRHPFKVTNSIETTTSGIDIPTEVPGSHMEPDVLETLYLSQHSLSDNSRRLVQTSDIRTQSVCLSDHVRVDTSNQLDTDEDCKQSYSACDAEVHVESDQPVCTHTGKGPFSCNICRKNFTLLWSLKTHIHVHKGEGAFSCKVCEKKFRKSSQVLRHMRIHTGEKSFSCEECGDNFTQPHSLRKHMLLHTGKQPFSCEACSKKFTQLGHLTRHMRIHTGEKPFACKDCDKKFIDYSGLRTHMLVHTGGWSESPFSCNFCGKTYTRLSNLNTHMHVHSGKRHFSCEICDKKFKTSADVKTHMSTHTIILVAR